MASTNCRMGRKSVCAATAPLRLPQREQNRIERREALRAPGKVQRMYRSTALKRIRRVRRAERSESFETIHPPADCDFAADGGHSAGGYCRLPAAPGLRPA